MRPVASIVVVFVSNALARELALAGKHTSDKKDSMDNLVEELVDKMVDHVFNGWPLHHTDLLNTALAQIHLEGMRGAPYVKTFAPLLRSAFRSPSSPFHIQRTLSSVPGSTFHPTHSLPISPTHEDNNAIVDPGGRRQLIAGFVAAAVAAVNVEEAIAADESKQLAEETALLEQLVLEDSLASLAEVTGLGKKQAALASAAVKAATAPGASNSDRKAAEKAEQELFMKAKEAAALVAEAGKAEARADTAAITAAESSIRAAVEKAKAELLVAEGLIKSAKAFAQASMKAVPKTLLITDASPTEQKQKRAAVAVAVVSAGKAETSFGAAEQAIERAARILSKEEGQKAKTKKKPR